LKYTERLEAGGRREKTRQDGGGIKRVREKKSDP
jgi:hypothetical protein